MDDDLTARLRQDAERWLEEFTGGWGRPGRGPAVTNRERLLVLEAWVQSGHQQHDRPREGVVSGDLTARLEEAIRDFRPPIVGPARWALAARLAEVAQNYFEITDEYKQVEAERDEAVRLIRRFERILPDHALVVLGEARSFLARHKEAQR